MKVKATFTEIKNRRAFVLGVGYCQLQRVLRLLSYDVDLYNATSYGWACDFYPINADIGIVTGYNYDWACDISAYDLVPSFKEKIKKIEQKAFAISFGDEKRKAELKAEFENLLEQAKNGVFDKGQTAYIKMEQCIDIPSLDKYKPRFLICENKKIKMRSTSKLIEYCQNFAEKHAEKHKLFYDWNLLNVDITDEYGHFIYEKYGCKVLKG